MAIVSNMVCVVESGEPQFLFCRLPEPAQTEQKENAGKQANSRNYIDAPHKNLTNDT